MRKNSLGDYLLYYLVRCLAFFFRLMPVGLALFIARQVGMAYMHFNAKRCRIAYANLKAALQAEYSPAGLKRILNRTYANIGQGVMELLFMPKMDARYVKRYIEFENFHFADEALKKGNGLIFLTAHFGTWEMGNISLPFRGFAFKAIVREQKPYLLNDLLNRYRQSKGCKMISKGPGIKEILRTLRSNGIAAMLVDQDAGKKGVFVKLFGREASWNPGVMEFGLKTKACLIPGFAIRQKGPYIKFKLFSPIDLSKQATEEEIIKDGFRQYISCMEGLIREYPDQWLWQHRRWKSTPVRSVLILDDGKTGHLRQSQALTLKLKDIWQKRGYSGEDIRVKILKAEFKNVYGGWLLRLEANFSNRGCQGCMSCLRLCLKEESYKALMGAYADVIISCGSKTAAVNLILSKENNAKSILIMKPSFISIRKFDLAIMPKHDSPPPRLKNAVVTDGALNLINKNSIRVNAERLQAITGRLDKKGVGVLIGGSTKEFSMGKDAIATLLDNLIRACDKYDADIFLTTSRRTPKGIDELIKEKLGRYPRCKLLIIANEKNIEGAVEGILGLSDMTLVSEESISMVSEAASSGVYTVVFKQGGAVDKRHQAFLDNLTRNGFIEPVGVDNLFATISNFFDKRPSQGVLDDSAKIEVALEKLL